MDGLINSISFQDNQVSWVLAEAGAGQQITIKKAIESPLPLIINFDNLHNPSAALQIANHLKSLADKNDIHLPEAGFLLSAKFGLTKKVLVDQDIPQPAQQQLVKTELNYILPSKPDDYYIYYPDYSRAHNSAKEVLTIAIRKELLKFFQQIGREGQFKLSSISLNCLALDDLFRQCFPNFIGQTLLVNFTERGFELVIADETHFLNFSFKPYTRSLQSISQIEEKELFSAFASMLEDIQRPGPIDMPLYSISHIYVFGSYFRPQWHEPLQGQVHTPLRVLNPLESSAWKITLEDPNWEAGDIFKFVEPLANLF